MSAARFGTDGVRGTANADLTAELALALGRATARILPAAAFLVGRDTRRSGPLLQAAFSAGLATEGADVIDVGVLPTPALALLSERRSLPAAMISASHNPFGDNGIKLFSSAGTKLPVALEQEVERELESILDDPDRPPRRPTGHGVGRIIIDDDAAHDYRAYLPQTLDDRRLDGLVVVLDCAHGAASGFAPEIFAALGAVVTTLADGPNGTNINDGFGSTHPEALAKAVADLGADLGLAFDGDADRLVAVDNTGTVVDGDALLALFTVDLAERGQLAGDTVVITVMANLGFRRAMISRGIAMRETPVGDRHVLAALDAEGLSLGGEQSGHIVFRQRATTGDGVLTGLALADLVVRHGRPLADLTVGLVERVPQVLVNVVVRNPSRLDDATLVWDVVAEIEAELGDSGRVLLRASGTEPLVRVMVEAESEEQANSAVRRISEAVATALADPPA